MRVRGTDKNEPTAQENKWYEYYRMTVYSQ